MDSNTENRFSLSLIDFSKTKLLGQIYSDLAQPSVQKVGKALGTVFELSNTLTTPIWMLNEYVGYKKEVFKENMGKFKDKIDGIPRDKVCEVVPEIGVPIVEKLTYVTNEQIREAYLNLLANASSSDTALVAHPAFVGMIDRLSSDEAKIIQHLKGKPYVVFVNYKYNISTSGWQQMKKFATGLEFDVSLDFPQNINVYLNNLINLGIIDYEKGQHKLNEGLYAELRKKYSTYEEGLNLQLDMFKKIQSDPGTPEDIKKITNYSSLGVDKGYFDVTDFGQLFIKACTAFSVSKAS